MNYQNDIERMKQLATYGKSNTSSKNNKTAVMEHHVTANNGKIYAIIKENAYYYVKVSEPCANIVLENFECVNGEARRKESCYNSYNQAFKQLSLKVNSVNESHQRNLQRIDEKVSKPEDVSNIKQESINEMSKELARVREIMYNAANIGQKHNSSTKGWNTIKETKEYESYMVNHVGDPESNNPKGASEETQNFPFTEPADKKFQTNRDTEKANGKPETSSNPFSEKGDNYTEDPTGNTTKETPTKSGEIENDVTKEKSKDVKDLGKAMDNKGSVATQTPKGGTSVKINEDFGLEDETEDGTTMGEDTSLDDLEEPDLNIGDDMEDNEEISSTETDIDFSDDPLLSKLNDLASEIQELIDLASGDEGEETSLDPEMDNLDLNIDADENGDVENIDLDAEISGEEDIDENFWEGKKLVGSKIVSESGTVLHDFGNHPGYQKEPMTIPTHKMKEKPSTNDWDDESVKSDKPFGTEIGDSFPFEDTVDNATIKEYFKNQVVDKLFESMKKAGMLNLVKKK